MIFHQHKAIFFHIGKTAGTSVEHMILPGERDSMVPNRELMYGFDKDLNIYLHHAGCRMTLEIVGEEIFNTYFKFSIVRNPYTRLTSAYYYIHDHNRRNYGDFKSYILGLPERVTAEFRLRGGHEISQLYYTHIDGVQVVDYLGKFENLQTVSVEICDRLGISAKLPKVNTRRHPDYPTGREQSFYDEEMIAVMQEVYRDDFETFCYSDLPPGHKTN